MFDQIDVAYYGRLALDERDKATRVVGKLAERCRERALHYEAKARALAERPS